VAPCNASSIARILTQKPDLGTPEARGKLAERLCQDERPDSTFAILPPERGDLNEFPP